MFQDRGANLLNKTTMEEAVESDRSIYKIIVLAALGIISSFIFGYFLKLFISDGRFNFLLFSFLGATGFLIVFLLNVFFVKSASKIKLIIFLESLAFLAGALIAPFASLSATVFYNKSSINIAIGALASFLIFLWANHGGRTELNEMLKIRFWRICKKVIPKAIMALALFASVVYVYIGIGGASGKEFFISQSAFEKIFFPAFSVKIIQNFLPGFDFSLSAGELIKNLAVNQIKQNSQLNLLPVAAKKQLIGQAIKELENKFADFLGAPIDSKIKVSEILYQTAIRKILELPENIRAAIPAAIGVLFFLTIISFSLPIRWLVSVLTFFIYEIFLVFGFSVIMLEGKSKEIIILK